MSDTKGMHLYEELMLLSLRDNEGTIETGAWYHQAVAGAILAELLLQKRIYVGEHKDAVVELLDYTPVGDPLMDECLEQVRDEEKPRSLAKWLSRFSNIHDLKHRVAAGLVQRGILRADEDKVLLIFTRKIYPEIDHVPERELIDRLRSAVFEDAPVLDPRTIVLVALAHRTGLLAVTFGRKELKPRKERLDRIASGELIGKVAKEVIEAVQTAVIAASVVPTITASVTH
jgi:hypothetical protein